MIDIHVSVQEFQEGGDPLDDMESDLDDIRRRALRIQLDLDNLNSTRIAAAAAGGSSTNSDIDKRFAADHHTCDEGH